MLCSLTLCFVTIRIRRVLYMLTGRGGRFPCSMLGFRRASEITKALPHPPNPRLYLVVLPPTSQRHRARAPPPPQARESDLSACSSKNPCSVRSSSSRDVC